MCDHGLFVNSIHCWWEFKKLFLENIVDDKITTILSKELENINMGENEKVKYFNQRFNRILKNFPLDTQPYDSITIGMGSLG